MPVEKPSEPIIVCAVEGSGGGISIVMSGAGPTLLLVVRWRARDDM
jgi:homoserine kinase